MASEPRLPDDDPDSRIMNQPNALDDLVGQYIDRLNAGDKVLAEEVIFDHPEYGEEIVARLESFVAAMDPLPSTTSQRCPDSPLGTLGDYTLRRQIGRGGMGVVYEAWQESVDRQVALKVLPAGIAADPRAVGRFAREARVAAKLQHPNVVSVFGMGVEAETPYYAMELVEGETLAQILAKIKDAEPDAETPFGKKDDAHYFLNLAEVFADVADGLQHAHFKGVTHRDIKPSNLILDPDGRLRILDFGLARLEGQESLTLSGDVMGTPLYMSPEQARRKKIPVDHRTDVYSLGATMYEALCGRPPFRGKDHADTLSQIIDRDPVEPRKLNLRLPKDLETIVLKCLRKDSADRYRTAEALGQELRRFARGDAIETRPRTSVEIAWGRVRRHRTTLAIGTFFLLFVVLLAGLLLRQQRTERERIERLYGPKILAWLQSPPIARVGGRIGFEPRQPEQFAKDINRVLSDDELTRIFEGIDAIIEELPERPEAYYYRARANVLLGRREAAERDLLLLEEVGFVPGRLLRANLEWTAGQRDAALRILDNIEADPLEEWERALVRAYRDLAKKGREEAAPAFDALIDLQREQPFYVGSDIELRLVRGWCRLWIDDFWGALEDAAVLRFQAPGSMDSLLFHVSALYLQGQRDKAEDLLEGFFQDLPEDSVERDTLADAAASCYVLVAEYDLALKWCERIRKPLLHDRWRIQIEASRYGAPKDIISLVEKFTEKYPEHAAWTHSTLGGRLSNMKGSLAEKELWKVVELAPDSPLAASAMESLAYTHYRKHEYTQAVNLYERSDKIRRIHAAWPLGMYAQCLLLDESRPLQEREALAMKFFDKRFRSVKKEKDRRPYGHLAFHFHCALLEKQGHFPRLFEVLDQTLSRDPHKTQHPMAGKWAQLKLHSVISRLLRRDDLTEFREELGGLIEKLQEIADDVGTYDGPFARFLSTLPQALLRHPDHPVEDAVRAARELVEKKGRHVDLVSTLAHTLASSGDLRNAIVELEKGSTPPTHQLPRWHRTNLEWQLSLYRDRFLPQIASFESAEALAKSGQLSEGVGQEFVGQELVGHASRWLYRQSKDRESSTNWTAPEPLGGPVDEGWREGQGYFVFQDEAQQFQGRQILDWTGDLVTAIGREPFSYFQTTFNVEDPDKLGPIELWFEVAAADGQDPTQDVVSFYLNGEKVAEGSNSPAPPVRQLLNRSLLTAGSNVLAIELRAPRSVQPPKLKVILRTASSARKILADANATLSEEEFGPELLFLEACLLENAGSVEEAIKILDELVEILEHDVEPRPGSILPLWRLARLHAKNGNLDRAEELLWKCLKLPPEHEEIWKDWWNLVASGHRDAGEILNSLPLRPTADFGAHLINALVTATAGNALRINCGVDKGTEGLWLSDRFFKGGTPSGVFSDEIHGTDDASRYRTQRWFGRGNTTRGYSIPLPSGHYRVTLHFAEIWGKLNDPKTTLRRAFDVALEGTTVLENHDPKKAYGFATAGSEEFTVPVHDGFLDLELELPVGSASSFVSALEIQPLGTDAEGR